MTSAARADRLAAGPARGAMLSTTPSPADAGWRRRVPSNRRTSTSSEASRKRTLTSGPGRPELGDGVAQVLELAAGPADDERHPLGLGPRRGDQLGHLGDERRRHVVDHEPADVLEGGGRLRTTGARQARDDEELGHAAIVAGVPAGGGPGRRAGRQAAATPGRGPASHGGTSQRGTDWLPHNQSLPRCGHPMRSPAPRPDCPRSGGRPTDRPPPPPGRRIRRLRHGSGHGHVGRRHRRPPTVDAATTTAW